MKRDVLIGLSILIYTVFTLSVYMSVVRQKETPGKFTAVAAATTSNDELTTLVTAINQERAKQNQSPLIENSQLNKVAQSRANDMKSRGYYSHQSPDNLNYIDEMQKYDL